MSRAVRDLRWAIESPSLVDEVNVSASDCNSVQLPTIDSGDLQIFLADYTSHRVGYYFESLIHYWLLKIRNVDFIGKRLQIQDGKRTVGEIDFLYRDEQNRLTHLETAVKFYLHDPQDNPSGSHFIGPNAADNFERKIKRLLEHQLPVSERAYPDIQRRIAFVKGRIFYHPQLTRPTALPDSLAADHLKNTWLRHADINWFHGVHADGLFRILRKPHWLSDEVGMTDDDSLLTTEQLTSQLNTHFSDSSHPNLISVLKPDSTRFREVDRVFVVHNSWPAVIP